MSVKVDVLANAVSRGTTKGTADHQMVAIQWPNGQVTVWVTNGAPPPAGITSDLKLQSGPTSVAQAGEATVQFYHSSTGAPGSFVPSDETVLSGGPSPAPVAGAGDGSGPPYDKGIIRFG